ncbi:MULTISPECIES: hemin ABC transporter substrate-binding protein [unclassified Paludibacterium]|uniref:heme/hemin ABC transporter substrate-binding protein n=1 Tax=unclassified Paludibacterium TaxID=2618429 RepID=UPI001C03EBCA|nr:ABC transporter substrate-binding protein [Paludibacterium sp. B53371]BEV71934.1 hemin ABC transporter substrate-binding protein [Paludibacterium sp. THUN1379]
MHGLILPRRALLQGAAALGLGMLSPLLRAASRPDNARLVCVGGALTEIIYALGAERQLVGVDSTSRFPAAAQSLPGVGYARTLSAEGILSLAPGAVLASEDAGPPAVLRQISAAGVPVHILPGNHRFEGVLSRITRVGELTGRTTQAAQLQTRLQRDWQKVQGKVAARHSPPARVLFMLNAAPGQLLVAGNGTAADAMLRYAGARNALQGFNGYRPMTAEAVVAARPDALLLSGDGLAAAGGVEGVLRLPGVAQTPAGQQRRILSQDALLLLGFGPRLPQAVDWLVQTLPAGQNS